MMITDSELSEYSSGKTEIGAHEPGIAVHVEPESN